MTIIQIRSFLLGLVLCMQATACQANDASDKPIFLYLSPLTAKYLESTGSSNMATLTIWRKYLRKACKCFTELGRAELLAKPKSGVLILPSAEVLDDEERKAIENFSANGGSVLATWMTGTRDAKGQPTGYSFLENLFKIKVAGEFSRKNSEDWFLMPFGDGPLTWPVPAGRRMFTGDVAQNMLRVESGNIAAVGMNWERGKDDVGPIGVIAFNETKTSRGVYFSFPESAWGFSQKADMLAIMDSSIAWLQREPKLVKSAWPHANIAAQLIEMDTEEKFFSAPNFAKDLESIGIKGTFYSLTSEAVKYPEIVKDLLARGHEIAYHADVHLGFEKVKPEKQEERIKGMKEQLRGILGNVDGVATGFRAPTESYDATTEALLRQHGMLHHAADPASTDDRLPFFSKVEPKLGPQQALVVLPRTQYDDVSYTAFDYGPKATLDNMVYDLDLIVRSGAFGLLSVHTQNYVDGQLLQKVMPDYMKYIATYKDRIWIPRADQIAAWWRKRALVTVTQVAPVKPAKQAENSKKTEQSKDINLQVSVAAPGNVEGLTVFVMNPKSGVLASVQAVNSSAPRVRVKLVDAFRSALVFEKLDTGMFDYVIRYP
jgi:Polysaccharide deacetylase